MQKSFWIFNFPFLYTHVRYKRRTSVCTRTPFYDCFSFYIYFKKESIFGIKGDSSILPAAFECVKMNRDKGIQSKRVWIIYGGGRNRETKQTFEPKITITNHLSKWILHSEIYWNSGDRFYSLWRNSSTFSSIEVAKNGKNFGVSRRHERSTTDRTRRVFIRQTVSSLSHGNFAI